MLLSVRRLEQQIVRSAIPADGEAERRLSDSKVPEFSCYWFATQLGVTGKTGNDEVDWSPDASCPYRRGQAGWMSGTDYGSEGWEFEFLRAR